MILQALRYTSHYHRTRSLKSKTLRNVMQPVNEKTEWNVSVGTCKSAAAAFRDVVSGVARHSPATR